MNGRLSQTIRKIRITAWSPWRFLPRGVLMVMMVLMLFTLAVVVGQLLKIPAIQEKNGPIITTANLSDVSDVPATAFARQNNLIVGVNNSFSQINPLFSANDGEMDAVSLIFESLIRLDEQGQPTGQLASSWTFDPASHRLVFQLNADHIFRDGRTVQNLDVIFTYQCALAVSYDGPWQGRLAGILAVSAGETPTQVVFTLADWLEKPDFRIFTLGILKSDYYACSLDRVFDIQSKNLAPEGSGSFEMVAQSADSVTLQRRNGYGGTVRSIQIRQVASEDKYYLLKSGELDIVRNLWDVRMQERAPSLDGYHFNLLETSVDSYFLVNPEPQASNVIQRPSQRLAVLLSAAGKELSELQRNALLELADKPLKLYYFNGIDEHISISNRMKADKIIQTLQSAGLTVIATGTDWPDLASRATGGKYDILLLPATSNSRLPRQITILGEPVQPAASAWITGYLSEVYITSKRMSQLSINPMGHPFAAAAGTWTDRIENVRFLDASGAYREENTP